MGGNLAKPRWTHPVDEAATRRQRVKMWRNLAGPTGPTRRQRGANRRQRSEASQGTSHSLEAQGRTP
eukprot:1379434-Pyramimonas_sp.AAC.1